MSHFADVTWKSTAAAGIATVAATWLASYAPARAPRPALPAPSVEHTETAAAAIQREADRLHARLAQVGAYRDPARNPFKYAGHPPARAIARPAPMMAVENIPVSPQPVEPTLRFTLSGIAEDRVGDTTVRTAIISTPSDVLLVKVGEQIGDQYRLEKIGADGVELVNLATGASVTLMLRR